MLEETLRRFPSPTDPVPHLLCHLPLWSPYDAEGFEKFVSLPWRELLLFYCQQKLSPNLCCPEYLLPDNACWLCRLCLPHCPSTHSNGGISGRRIHICRRQLPLHSGDQAPCSFHPGARDTEIIGVDQLYGKSTRVGGPTLHLPLDLPQVGDNHHLQISLHGLLTHCDREDRGRKLSSLWRTRPAPWDRIQESVGPFCFLLPRLHLHSNVQNWKPGSGFDGNGLE